MNGPARPMLIDMRTQRQSILEAIHLLRSEYLRTNGYFLPPETSVACWESYRSLIAEFVKGFDIKTACGYHPEWISEACLNVTSQAQFESLTPKSKLLEIRRRCNQSMESFACESCTSEFLSLRKSYLHDSGGGNFSNSSGYPFMYAAAIVNQFGPTNRATVSIAGLLIANPIGMAFLLKEHHLAPDGVPVLALTGAMVYIGFYSIGMGPIP